MRCRRKDMTNNIKTSATEGRESVMDIVIVG